MKSIASKSGALIAGLVLFGGAFTMSLSVPSDAITNPISGSVPKPGAFQVSWPFQAGQRVHVTSGYGSGMGSTLHRNTNAPGNANDHFALDLTLPDHPNNGHGQPVLAMASGTIVKAGWATAGWANYGLRVIVRHDWNDDGHTYITHYAHLDQLSVSEGDRVAQGQQLGTLGDSCEGDIQNRACPFFGAHLHVAMHRDSSVGGSGTGGTYGGNAVVMEPIDGAEDIVQGNRFTSQNNGQPPQPCQIIGRREATLEDDGPCLQRFGPPQFWHDEAQGHGGHAFWTYTIAEPAPDNHVRWSLHFAEAGEYDLWAFIPRAFGESGQARYRVRHEGREDQALRSQRDAPDDWLSLGRFRFGAGGDQWVALEDNTGEPYIDANNNTKIVFDALRVAPAQDCACSGDDTETVACGRCGARSRTCGGCDWGDFGACGSEGPCDPDDTEEQACGQGGVQRRACTGACQWGDFGICEDQDVPDAGTPDASDPDPDPNPAPEPGVTPSPDVPEPDGVANAEPDPRPDTPGGARVKEGCATPMGAPSTPVALWWLVVAAAVRSRRRSG